MFTRLFELVTKLFFSNGANWKDIMIKDDSTIIDKTVVIDITGKEFATITCGTKKPITVLFKIRIKFDS